MTDIEIRRIEWLEMKQESEQAKIEIRKYHISVWDRAIDILRNIQEGTGGKK